MLLSPFFLRIRKGVFGLLSARGRRALGMRVAVGIEHRAAFRDIAGIDTIVDVGANRGQFSLFARWRYPSAKIIAIEPLPEAYEVYGRIFQGDKNTRCILGAAGAEDGYATLNVTRDDDSSSFLAPAELQREIFGTEVLATRRVEVRRLDNLIAAKDFGAKSLLKIDVQGFELDVLRGASIILDRISYVYTECSFVSLYGEQPLAPDIIDFLFDHGFELLGLFNSSGNEQFGHVQADLLFEKMRT